MNTNAASPTRRTFFKKVARTGSLIAVGLGVPTAYGFYEASQIRIRRETIAIPGLPQSFEGKTIAMLSDFHRGPYVGMDFLQQAKDIAQGFHAEMIVLVGDFAHKSTNTRLHLPECVELLSGLKAPLGVYGVPGNHDLEANGKYYRQAMQQSSIGTLVCEIAYQNDHLSIKGKVVWSCSFRAQYKADVPVWGFCGHPLVQGDTVYCLVGGKGSAVVAFNKNTGKELWKNLSVHDIGYSPPSIVKVGKHHQLIIWHSKKVVSLDPKNGEIFWQVDLSPRYGMSINIPRCSKNMMFAGGIGGQSVMLQLNEEKPEVKELWRGNSRTSVNPANGTPMFVDDVIYGCDCMTGSLRAVDAKTGERLWETLVPTAGERVPHGTAFLVLNQDHYYIFSETGNLIIAQLSRKEYKELSRFKIIEPTGEAFGRKVVWSHPAFANKCVYARNDKEIVCYSLAQ